MGVFDDKKFEELDWISQATEPIDSQMNEVLSKIPDIVEVDFCLYKKLVTDGYGLDLNVGRVVLHVIRQNSNLLNISHQQLNLIEDCFKLEATGDKLILDFENEKIYGGQIRLIKIATTMDEKVLEGFLGREGIEALSYSSFHSDGALSRANEVMEILGKCEDGLRTRSERRKRQVISKRLQILFKTNEWKLKDTELANKVGFWIKDYISEGNIAAFSNFCRLKVMTHKDQPIYSMEEIK